MPDVDQGPLPVTDGAGPGPHRDLPVPSLVEGHAREAIRRFELAIGEVAVWVGASAAHRDAAFDACRWIIDEVKARVPIWKHERYADGDAGWLHPQAAEPSAD